MLQGFLGLTMTAAASPEILVHRHRPDPFSDFPGSRRGSESFAKLFLEEHELCPLPVPAFYS